MRVRGWHETADMERLSGLDASFLYIESPTVSLHVCSIVELDTCTIPGGYTFDRFHDDLASRIKALPVALMIKVHHAAGRPWPHPSSRPRRRSMQRSRGAQRRAARVRARAGGTAG